MTETNTSFPLSIPACSRTAAVEADAARSAAEDQLERTQARGHTFPHPHCGTHSAPHLSSTPLSPHSSLFHSLSPHPSAGGGGGVRPPRLRRRGPERARGQGGGGAVSGGSARGDAEAAGALFTRVPSFGAVPTLWVPTVTGRILVRCFEIFLVAPQEELEATRATAVPQVRLNPFPVILAQPGCTRAPTQLQQATQRLHSLLTHPPYPLPAQVQFAEAWGELENLREQCDALRRGDGFADFPPFFPGFTSTNQIPPRRRAHSSSDERGAYLRNYRCDSEELLVVFLCAGASAMRWRLRGTSWTASTGALVPLLCLFVVLVSPLCFLSLLRCFDVWAWARAVPATIAPESTHPPTDPIRLYPTPPSTHPLPTYSTYMEQSEKRASLLRTAVVAATDKCTALESRVKAEAERAVEETRSGLEQALEDAQRRAEEAEAQSAAQSRRLQLLQAAVAAATDKCAALEQRSRAESARADEAAARADAAVAASEERLISELERVKEAVAAANARAAEDRERAVSLVTAAQQREQELSREVEALQLELRKAAERISAQEESAAADVERFADSVALAKGRIQELSERLSRKDEETDALSQALTAATERLAQQEERSAEDAGKYTEALSLAKTHIEGLSRQIADKDAEIAALTAQLEEEQGRLGDAGQRLRAVSAAAQADLRQAADRLAAKEEEADTLRRCVHRISAPLSLCVVCCVLLSLFRRRLLRPSAPVFEASTPLEKTKSQFRQPVISSPSRSGFPSGHTVSNHWWRVSQGSRAGAPAGGEAQTAGGSRRGGRGGEGAETAPEYPRKRPKNASETPPRFVCACEMGISALRCAAAGLWCLPAAPPTRLHFSLESLSAVIRLQASSRLRLRTRTPAQRQNLQPT